MQAEVRLAERAPVRTLDDVLAQLAGVVAATRAAGSSLGCFAAVYRQLVRRLQSAVAAGSFADGARVEALEAALAGRYLAVFDALAAGGGEAPECWRLAWTASREDRLIVLQNVLLGLSAHLGFDLGVAAAQAAQAEQAAPAQPGEAVAALRPDLDGIFDLVGALLPSVEAAIGSFSPQLGLLDELGGRGAEPGALGFSLAAARAGAWNQAVVLAHLPSAAWPAALAGFDRQATALGRLIADPGGLAAKAVEVIRLTESLDVPAMIDALDALPPR